MLSKQNIFGLFIGTGITVLGYWISLFSESGIQLMLVGMALITYAILTLLPIDFSSGNFLRKKQALRKVETLPPSFRGN